MNTGFWKMDSGLSASPSPGMTLRYGSPSSFGEALRDHLVGVGAEAGGGKDAVELGAHEPLASRVVAPPLPEGLHEARRQGRVTGVERQNLVGEQRIALAALGVEMQRVALREG